MMFEVLHGPLARFRCSSGRKGPKIFSFPGFSVFLARIKTIFSAAQFSNHDFEYRESNALYISYAAFRVRLAFSADAWREAGPRFRAADLACVESAVFEAAECPFF